MDAANKMLSAFAATGLEGPTTVDESVVGVGDIAEVFALGVSSGDLAPDAEAAIGFLSRRLYTTFIVPALATPSSGAFVTLWSEQSGAALRLMDAVALCLYEAQRESRSDVLVKRLEHSDRRVVHASAQTLGQHFSAALGDELRLGLTIIEAARAVFREPSNKTAVEFFGPFYRGLLIWALGNHLSTALADRASGFVQGSTLRTDLATDVIGFASEGARIAGLFSVVAMGLGVIGDTPQEDFKCFRSTTFVAFMLRAISEIKRVFDGDVRFALARFDYPDEPGQWEFHIVIDTSAPPQDAGEALDRLCEEWWDRAAADLDVDIHPVLGVFEDG